MHNLIYLIITYVIAYYKRKWPDWKKQIARTHGDGNKTGDVWKAFAKLWDEKSLNDSLSTNGYESENSSIQDWLKTNDNGYSKRLLKENTQYCVEYYDERFNGNETDSIVEIWIPIEKV